MVHQEQNSPSIREFSGQMLVGSRPHTELSKYAETLNVDRQVIIFCRDPDLAEAFEHAVPDKGEQARFLVNTSASLMDQKYDPSYVIIFRRTLPSDLQKPESHWSSDYFTTVNGLRREIPEGPHRLHSIILCATLTEIQKEGLAPLSGAVSDGEIKILGNPFDQHRALFYFKPSREKAALAEYLLTEGALDLKQISSLVQTAAITRQ